MPLKLNSSGGGSVTVDVPSTASNYTATLPATTGTVVLADGSNNVSVTNLTASGNVTAGGTVVMSSPFAMRNKIINGAMEIDQRNAGASISPVDNQYLLDRWAAGASVGSKYTVQQNGGGVTPPTGYINYLGVTSSSAYSVGAGDYFYITQKIEGLTIPDFAWGTAGAKSVTLSFWVRSSLTGTFSGSFRNSAATRSYVFTYTISSSNTWEQKTITIPGDTSGTWLTTNGVGAYLALSFGVGSTYSTTAGSWGAGNYLSATGATSVVGTNGATFYLTGVQLEVGSVATPFERRFYSQELAMCQRYYTLLTSQLVYSYVTGSGFITINNIALPVTMRASPTAAYSSVSTNLVSAGPSTNTVTSTSLRVSITSSGAGYSYADYTVALSAEL